MVERDRNATNEQVSLFTRSPERREGEGEWEWEPGRGGEGRGGLTARSYLRMLQAANLAGEERGEEG